MLNATNDILGILDSLKNKITVLIPLEIDEKLYRNISSSLILLSSPIKQAYKIKNTTNK